jgi:hypothetical protein
MATPNPHHDLPKKEIRDLIAKTLTEAYDNRAYSKIEDARKELEIAQKRLEASERLLAAKTLLKQFGWEHFDVSDKTPCQFGFVGTQQEHDEKFA